MDANTAAVIQAWAAVVQTILVALTFIISILISIYLYYRTNRLTSAQYMRSTFEAWLTADMFFLQDGNEDLLKILADLAPQVDNAVLTPEIKIEQQKKRLSYFLVLNPFYSYFYALNSMNASKEMREKFKNQ